MPSFNKIARRFITITAIILAVLAVLSLLNNTESRYLKMLDFPRIQFFLTAVLLFFLILPFSNKKQWERMTTFIAALIIVFINGSYLINYTPLVSVVVPAADDAVSADATVSLFIVNVKMSNRTGQPLIDLVQERNADVVLAMEVDNWWDKELSAVKKEYPYVEKSINKVTYGMILYSKFPLDDFKISYLNNKNVPSFESTITLKNGKTFRLHTVHPVPPTRFEDIPDNVGQKEKALPKIGRQIEKENLPTIVAGDLNDVVWSNTDDLTETENLLHDVRVGRGFYNSYNANNLFASWPLDHVFVTKEFKLKKLERLRSIGSDHFPMYVELTLD